MDIFSMLFRKEDESVKRRNRICRYIDSEFKRYDCLTFSEALTLNTFAPIKAFGAKRNGRIRSDFIYPLDVILLEIGCHILALVDLLVYINAKDMREGLMEMFHFRFRQIFSNSLDMSDGELIDVVNKRMAIYAEAFRAKQNIDSSYDTLYFLICESISINAIDVKNIAIMKTELLIWRKHFFPSISRNLETAIAAIRNQ